MQRRFKHKIKDHKLDFKKIKKESIAGKRSFDSVLISLLSLPSLITGYLIIKGLGKGYIYALRRFKAPVKVRWSNDPYTFEGIIIALFFFGLLILPLAKIIDTFCLLEKNKAGDIEPENKEN